MPHPSSLPCSILPSTPTLDPRGFPGHTSDPHRQAPLSPRPPSAQPLPWALICLSAPSKGSLTTPPALLDFLPGLRLTCGGHLPPSGRAVTAGPARPCIHMPQSNKGFKSPPAPQPPCVCACQGHLQRPTGLSYHSHTHQNLSYPQPRPLHLLCTWRRCLAWPPLAGTGAASSTGCLLRPSAQTGQPCQP